MKKSDRLAAIYTYLEEQFYTHPMPVIDLMKVSGESPYRILTATILSSRTKDDVTAKAASRLFAQAPDLSALAVLGEDTIAKLIYPVGFYKTKARHLHRLPTVVLEKHGGVIPTTLSGLLSLPGVGRKTAALVLAVAFDQDAICVDTHVHRITNRLGFVDTDSPAETEQALMTYLPRSYWSKTNAYFVSFGQNRCTPRSPRCDACGITEFCAYFTALEKE
ncbi:MAG: endonuclease III domain-containing protein [Fibrobacterota bacterium]